MYYESFEIKNFRLFKNIRLNNLERVNLITGKNNVGKTSLLEAIFLHSGYFNPELTINIQAWRGTPGWHVTSLDKGFSPWDILFYNLNTDNIIQLISFSDNNVLRKTTYSIVKDQQKLTEFYEPITDISDSSSTITPSIIKVIQISNEEEGKINYYYMVLSDKGMRKIPPLTDVPFQTVFTPSVVRFSSNNDTDIFSKLKISGNVNVIIDAIRIIDEKIEDITISTIGSIPELYVDIGLNKYIPLFSSGEGMVKIVHLLLAIYEAKNGIMLIDEIENGFHYTILPKIWEIIDQASKIFNTQVFATTHSLEVIKNAHKYFSNLTKYNFKLFRLQRKQNIIDVIEYDKNVLDAAIENNLEVR